MNGSIVNIQEGLSIAILSISLPRDILDFVWENSNDENGAVGLF